MRDQPQRRTVQNRAARVGQIAVHRHRGTNGAGGQDTSLAGEGQWRRWRTGAPAAGHGRKQNAQRQEHCRQLLHAFSLLDHQCEAAYILLRGGDHRRDFMARAWYPKDDSRRLIYELDRNPSSVG